MEIDKQNDHVAFNDAAHTYFDVTDDTKKYTSVTTLIHKYTQPFDEDFWSAYKALEKLLPKEYWMVERKSLLNTKKFDKNILDTYKISIDDFNREQQAVLDAWDLKRRESCERGTRIHSELEHSFYNKKNISLAKYEIGGKFECKKDYNKLDLISGIYPEYLIYYEEDGVNIAGQIDLLVKDGNNITIGDWKSNAEIKQKSFYNNQTKTSTKMLYPLNNLDDVNYWHYTMQLSFYAYMIKQRNPEFVIKDLVLIHFDHNDKMTVYHLDYLEKEVKSVIDHYRKQLKINESKNKRKKIEY